MGNKGKKFIITVLFSTLAVAIYYLINFFLTPYITENIGAEAYGFVSLAKNFASYAGIITIALNSYATRFIAVSYHRGETEKSNRYFSSVYYADIVLGLIILLFFCICIWKLEYLFNISPLLVRQVKQLFFFVGLNFTLVTSMTIFSSSVYIKNQLDKLNIFKGLSYVIEAVVLIILFYNYHPNVAFVGISTIAATMVLSISNYLLYRKYTPEIILSRKYFSIESVKELVGKGIWNSLNSLGNTLNSGLDLIVCNLMLNVLSMGQLAIAKTMSSMFYTLFQLLAQPFQPIFLEDYSQNNKKKLIVDLTNSVKIAGLFSNLAFAGFFSLGRLYYKLWIPNQDINMVWLLTVITIFGSIVEGAIFPLYYIYTLTVKNKIPCIVTIVGGLVNVVGMFVLIKFSDLGIYSVVLTTAIIMTFINFVFNPIYMAHCLNEKKTLFYPILCRHIISTILMTCVFEILVKSVGPYNWITLIAVGLLCCLVGGIMHVIIVGITPKQIRKILKRR